MGLGLHGPGSRAVTGQVSLTLGADSPLPPARQTRPPNRPSSVQAGFLLRAPEVALGALQTSHQGDIPYCHPHCTNEEISAQRG